MLIKRGSKMVILWLVGLAGLIGIIYIVIAMYTHDYTKDEKTGEDKKEDIDDFLLPK